MTHSRPSLTAPRPDPGTVLLEAIDQRDIPRCRRLLLQWVHRRGLASLEEFRSTTLASVAGSEACRWLEALLDEPSTALPQPAARQSGQPVAEPAATVAPPIEADPPIRLHDLIDADAVSDAEAVRDAEAVERAAQALARVEAAFAALAAEFATAAPAAPLPENAVVTPPPVAAALPLSFEIAAATDRAAAAAAAAAGAVRFGEEGEPPSEAAHDPEPEELPEPAELPLPERRFPLPRLRRLKSLVRGCYEGALGSLQASRPGAETLREPSESLDPAAADVFAEVDGFDEPLGLMAEPAAEPVAPLPAFHAPVIVGMDDLPPPSSSTAAAAADAAAESSRDGVRQAKGALPFRLPRLGAAGAPHRPAPAPDALADLRAWLPDDDLPRAC